MRDSSEVWTGKASSYDQVRPRPPSALPDLLTQLVDMPRPALVVDLGSGTGLSTMIWAERAERVVGIEPNADMRQVAMSKLIGYSEITHIEYREGFAHRTGLPDECADIVTIAHAFHWMEPASTLDEITRILRPGGLFAAYECNLPPAIHWELDQLALKITQRVLELLQQRGLAHILKMWPGNKSLDLLRESGRFRFTREVVLHHIEQGNAARYLAMMQSGAFSYQFQFTDQEIGLDRLKQAALQYIGSEPVSWYFSYRVRIGVK